ncbi:MAG: hypothetical protein KDK65_04520 [Chlamydiia bacterium]|nr:hypothetical protein [Chlamydiia bacterium]
MIHFKDVSVDALFLHDETLFFRGLLQPLIPNLSHNRLPEEFAKDIYHKALISFVNGHKDLLFANSPDGEQARSVVQLAFKKLLRSIRGCPPEQFPDVLHQWLGLRCLKITGTMRKQTDAQKNAPLPYHSILPFGKRFPITCTTLRNSTMPSLCAAQHPTAYTNPCCLLQLDCRDAFNRPADRSRA